MANVLRTWTDRFLGRGDAAVTVPPLDGALKPNNHLEDAPSGISAVEPDDMVVWEGAAIFSSANKLYRILADGTASPFHTATGMITALAAAPSGELAIANDQEGPVFLRGTGGTRKQIIRNITAMTFADDKTLLICVGSKANSLDDWQRDLMDGGRTGEILVFDMASGSAKKIVGSLAFPNGIVIEPNGDLIISESWEKRLVRYSSSGKFLGQVMEDLPGYPARIASSSRGGYWLSIFAPRSQLIEFVLREPEYRKAMMAEVDKEFWIAPALRSGCSFHEPMQGGALKQMGQLKPWAPTRSYGLAVELTPDFEPVRSLHSRAGGKRHGVTSTVENEGILWIASKGGNEIVAFPVQKRVG